MCMATNGTLIDDAVCEKMKAAQLRMVSLSLDGSTAAIHDDFRSMPGAFDGTLRGVAFLKKHGIPFLINSSFTKRNQADIANVMRLAKSLGATAWYMFMIVPTGRGEDIMSELISKEDYEEILKWHYEMEKGESELLVRPTCAPHYYRIVPQMAKAEGVKFQRRSLTFSTGGGKGCIAAQSICLIDAFGEVKPCSYFPVSAGNVKKTPFREIWEKSPLFLRAARLQGLQGQVRPVRVPERLRRLPRPRLRRDRRLPGRGAVLHLHPDPHDEERLHAMTTDASKTPDRRSTTSSRPAAAGRSGARRSGSCARPGATSRSTARSARSTPSWSCARPRSSRRR